MKAKPLLRHFLLVASALAAQSAAAQTTYTWIRTTGGAQNWTTEAAWNPAAVPSPVSGDIMDFSSVNIASNTTLTLGADRAAETWKFGDTTGTTVWTVADGNSILLAGTTPTIQVSAGSRALLNNVVTGTSGLTKTGTGVLQLAKNTSNISGNIRVSGGILDFGAIPNGNIGGGGTARNITVDAGAAVRFNTLTNAFLNRIVQTNDEIAVMTGALTNPLVTLDFSAATGANLPNAFLSNYASNGAKAEISNTLIFDSNYRLGSPLQSGALGILQASPLSGSNGLIVAGNRVVVVGAHTFTGDTTIRDGARLGLAAAGTTAAPNTHSLALQNSVLNLGTPSSTGVVFFEAATTAGPITGSNPSAAGGTESATFGGLSGSRNLFNSFLFTAPGNNTSAKVATAITGFTLNVGAGVTANYTGAIGGFGAGAAGGLNGASTLTKTGEGTQILGGVNTYNGATNVNAGTLVIGAGGSTHGNSAVTVSNDAKLVVNGTVNGSLLAGANTTVSGSGIIGGNATIQGLHSPGSSPDIQSYLGDLSYSGGSSSVLWELVANSTSGRGVNFDGIDVGGALSFTDATTLNLSFNFGGSAVDWTNSFWDTSYLGVDGWLIYSGATSLTGFSNLTLATDNWEDGLGQLFGANLAGSSFGLFQSGNDIFLNYSAASVPPSGVIPEPASALAICLLLSGGTLLRSRRRA